MTYEMILRKGIRKQPLYIAISEQKNYHFLSHFLINTAPSFNLLEAS